MTLSVSPSMSFAPADLVVRAIVPPDEANRAINIVAESETFYRSSEVQLDGEQAPRVTVREFSSLPAGEYDVSAVLFGQGARRIALARQRVKVLGVGDGSER